MDHQNMGPKMRSLSKFAPAYLAVEWALICVYPRVLCKIVIGPKFSVTAIALKRWDCPIVYSQLMLLQIPHGCEPPLTQLTCVIPVPKMELYMPVHRANLGEPKFTKIARKWFVLCFLAFWPVASFPQKVRILRNVSEGD
mmetsp:Transcript_11099/g.15404  ORF Transcript_11099/g.15404 Transcript_11099/m.15404 type:complete len:140 (-) Transcript_11099:127-546(-)